MPRAKKEIDFEAPINKIRPKLYNFLESLVARKPDGTINPKGSKVDGRSYQKFRNIFTHAKTRTHLKEQYEAIKEHLENKPGEKFNATPIQKNINKKLKEKEYHLVVNFYSEGQNFEGQKPYMKNGQPWYLMFHSQKDRLLTVKGPDPFPDIIKQFVEKPSIQLTKRKVQKLGSEYSYKNTPEHKLLWDRSIKMFCTDDEFAENYKLNGHYIAAFKVLKMTVFEKESAKHNPLDANLKDTQKVSINNTYIESKIDTTFDTFKEAIANKHYKVNQCWINTITDVYGDTLLSNRRRDVVNRANILNIIGKTEEDIEDGVSVNDMLPFFQKYDLQLRVYDDFMNPILIYNPRKISHHNKVLYCMVKGNHVYTLNSNLSVLAQKQQQEKDKINIYASSSYYIRKDDTVAHYKMIEGIDDIVKIIRELKEDKPDNGTEIKLIHKNNNLCELVYDLKDAGYEPLVKYKAGHIIRLDIKVAALKSIKFSIETQNLVKGSMDGGICVNTEDIYNNMNKAMCKFNQMLIKPALLSHYSSNDVEILNEYRTTVPLGLLKKVNSETDICEIDISKAFTAAFLEIKEVPVFNEFDYFRPYDGHIIKNLNLYVVQVFRSNLMFNKTYNLCYGMFLKNFKCKIIFFKEPSFIKSIDTKTIIDTLYDTEISPNPEEDKTIKKLIANVNFGLLEKSTNKSQVSKLYETLSEARCSQEKYGGRIQLLSRGHEVRITKQNDLDAGLDIESECTEWISDEKVYYILNLSDTATLKNGFRYIKELLLQFHNFKMYTDHKILRDNNIDVFSVKTDAMTIKSEDYTLATSLLKMSNEIGGWRLSKHTNINISADFITLKKNKEIKLDVPTFERIEIKDEYDVNEICESLEKYKRVMIRAEMPGSGKSYVCEKMKARGHKVLFVCPTNVLVQNYKECGVTVNKFFSMSVDIDDFMSKFDSSDYDVIVFDEIYMSCILKLRKIKQYSESNQNKIIIATGDTCQLEPIEKLSNTINYEKYADHCINSIFPNEIFLFINKRLKSEEDKLKLIQIKQDIFNEDIPMLETISKYFKFTTEVTQSLKNIAFLNSTCKSKSMIIRKSLGKTGEYEVGEYITCRKWTKHNKHIFNVNYQYQIKSINCNNTITIIDESVGDTYTLPIKMIRDNFIFSYCNTCHSYQGSSIKESMTIFDYKHFFVSRKWLWTAITRATDLNNVWFFEYNEDNEKEQRKLQVYFKKKIDGYKCQDRNAKRSISENYVDVDWFMKCVGTNCSHCNVSLEYDINFGDVNSNITAQRNDNSQDHNLNNIVPMCIKCNCSLR
jgi:hypothetical protein